MNKPTAQQVNDLLNKTIADQAKRGFYRNKISRKAFKKENRSAAEQALKEGWSVLFHPQPVKPTKRLKNGMFTR